MGDINMTIIKRDGSRVSYNNEKIQKAVAKALMASGEVATKRVSTTAQIIGCSWSANSLMTLRRPRTARWKRLSSIFRTWWRLL